MSNAAERSSKLRTLNGPMGIVVWRSLVTIIRAVWGSGRDENLTGMGQRKWERKNWSQQVKTTHF